VSRYVKNIVICPLEAKIRECAKKGKKPSESSRPGIIEAVHANINCAPSFVSAYAHVLLLDCVREMIRLTSNVLAVQSDPPPLLAYISAAIEPVFCLQHIYMLSATPRSKCPVGLFAF
jgi:hypothetical protein